MLIIIKQNGLGSGGLNFDAKVRRSSTDLEDLFHAHIGGMDTFARGLLIAHEIMKDKVLKKFVEERYVSFTTGIGHKIMSGKADMAEVEKWVRGQGSPVLQSARQEMLENLINSYIQ